MSHITVINICYLRIALYFAVIYFLALKQKLNIGKKQPLISKTNGYFRKKSRSYKMNGLSINFVYLAIMLNAVLLLLVSFHQL